MQSLRFSKFLCSIAALADTRTEYDNNRQGLHRHTQPQQVPHAAGYLSLLRPLHPVQPSPSRPPSHLQRHGPTPSPPSASTRRHSTRPSTSTRTPTSTTRSRRFSSSSPPGSEAWPSPAQSRWPRPASSRPSSTACRCSPSTPASAGSCVTRRRGRAPTRQRWSSSRDATMCSSASTTSRCPTRR